MVSLIYLVDFGAFWGRTMAKDRPQTPVFAEETRQAFDDAA
jgi:hypothetical protein